MCMYIYTYIGTYRYIHTHVCLPFLYIGVVPNEAAARSPCSGLAHHLHRQVLGLLDRRQAPNMAAI